MAVSFKWVVTAGVVTGLVLASLSERRAEPDRPAVVPKRLEIPALDLSAPLMRLGLTRDGEVELPPFERPEAAGWFTGSAVPGDPGASVIIGHVDTKTEPAVFYRLHRLRKGDLVKVVRSDGKVARYRVDAVERVPKERFPAKRVYTGDGLRLITCGGVFDRRSREYRDNVIVYASAAR
ncbi:hypothetical protein TBS_26490 [Thermobispora bispora]|uniref:class F sortase n=1 Tax=Thermobispora bispora TaxID=2006 RepID=UPI0019807163|nr:class F sortase [Thermobispora bispora]MBO2475611.1 class F sortase [Actinomycetales bacterium]MBX6166449.1 class F sortase [Thermobispora bispora]MDI9580156.1 class F sortase [Thermobispora sp.]QSI47285.1 class F sortase [Thermobispora bispora]